MNHKNDSVYRHPHKLRKRVRRAALVMREAARILLDDLVKYASFLEHESI